MLPPRGRKIFAKSLAQSYLVLSDKLVCFNQKLYGLVAKWFPGVLPLHGTSARSPLTTAKSALVEERGHSTRALPSRAGNAVPRDGCRRFRWYMSKFLSGNAYKGSREFPLFHLFHNSV